MVILIIITVIRHRVKYELDYFFGPFFGPFFLDHFIGGKSTPLVLNEGWDAVIGIKGGLRGRVLLLREG